MKKTISLAAILLCSLTFAQSFETYAHPTVSEIQKNFKYKKYPKTLLSEFSKEIIEDEGQIVTVIEHIPGEIIGWTNHRGSYTSSVHFLIRNNRLIPINVIPTSNSFRKKVNLYIPKNASYEFDSVGGRTNDPQFVRKEKNGKYLLKVNILAFKNGDEKNMSTDNSIGRYELEYETSDFKNFIPIRIRNEEEKTWQMIK